MIGRPTLRFTLAHPAHFIALGFGTGLAPIAPGTVGTILAFPIFALLSAWVPSLSLFGLILIFFGVGIWACERTGRDLGIADHSSMNWDEVVSMLLVLFVLMPISWEWQVIAFLTFRFFDVVKPPPIRHFDRTLKGGFGVMFDDVLAVGYTLLLISVLWRMTHW